VDLDQMTHFQVACLLGADLEEDRPEEMAFVYKPTTAEATAVGAVGKIY
jgi:hypothetical protein